MRSNGRMCIIFVDGRREFVRSIVVVRSIGKHVRLLVVIKGATSGNINLAVCEVLPFSALSGWVILEPVQ